MRGATADFLAGVQRIAPALPGLVPFGAIVGVAGVEAGLTETQVLGMSLLTYAGASQLVAFRLLEQGVAVPLIVAAALVVNLRLVMYSASIAPYLQRIRTERQWTMAYLLVDQVYALSLIEFTGDESTARVPYYFGVALPNWAAWEGGVLVGVVLGTSVPADLQLDFAIPLLFLAILVPTIEDRATATASLVGGTVAVAGMGLPLQLGLVTGAGAGLAAGLLVDGRQR